MAETLSTRFGMTVWGASTDTPQRTEFNGNFAAVETLAAIDKQNVFASRPAPGVQGTYFWDTTNGFLWRDNATSWDLVGQKTRDAYIRNSAVGVIPLIVDSIASQTANLIEARVNAAAMFSVTKDGNVSGGTFTGKSASFTNTVDATPVIFGKGSASQSANLLSLQNNASTNMFSVSPTGLITSPSFATTGSGAATATVANANNVTTVAGMSFWSGTASLEARMNRGGAFSDFMYLKHDLADNSAATRRLGLLMKVGDETSGSAPRSAAIYLQSTAALFDSPALRIDVRDQNLWSMDPSTGSTSGKPIVLVNSYIRSVPSGTGSFNSSNTWIGTQNIGNVLYYRSGSNSSGHYWYAGGDHSDFEADPGTGLTLASLLTYGGASGRFTVGKINITDWEDVSASTVNPALMIGAANDVNLIFDADEIEARNNGSLATLRLQHDGGTLLIGSAATAVQINDCPIYVSKNGSSPPSPSLGDLWLDSRSPSGGFKVYTSGGWVKM